MIKGEGKSDKERKELTIAEVINVLLYSIIIFMPFIFTEYAKPRYVAGKILYLYIIGIIILILMVKDTFEKYKLKRLNLEIKISLIFLLLILVSSIFSMDKMVAFFGSYHRREGFFMFCVYITIFIASTKYFKIREKELKIILVVADFMSLYGISQFLGWDPFSRLMNININSNSAIGFIGNRNFLSTYLLIFIFISVGMYIFYKQIIYLIISIPLFAGVLCTLTRGGWIGFIAFSAVGLLFIFKRKDCVKRAVVIFCIFLSILVCLDSVSDGRITGRVNKSAIVNENHEFVGSTGARLNILRMSFNAFKSNPILGSGPDNLIVKFTEDFQEDMENYKRLYGEVVDKAHNEYLEYAASLGIFTLIAYLALIIFIFKGLITNIKDDRAKIMCISLIGYLAQAFFNISVIMVAPLYWIMIGGFVKFINEDFNKEDLNEKDLIEVSVR